MNVLAVVKHLRDEQQASFGILGECACIDKLHDRDANLRGERHRVFVGETGDCGERTPFEVLQLAVGKYWQLAV